MQSRLGPHLQGLPHLDLTGSRLVTACNRSTSALEPNATAHKHELTSVAFELVGGTGRLHVSAAKVSEIASNARSLGRDQHQNVTQQKYVCAWAIESSQDSTARASGHRPCSQPLSSQSCSGT